MLSRTSPRPPGVNSTSPTFQLALQLKTFAFSPAEAPPSHAEEIMTTTPALRNINEQNSTIPDYTTTSICTKKTRTGSSTRSLPTSPEDDTASPRRQANWSQGQDTEYLHSSAGGTIVRSKGRGDSRKYGPLTWGTAERCLHLSRRQNLNSCSRAIKTNSRLSSAVNEQSSGLKRECLVRQMSSPPKPAECFDSGDMIMVAGLLAHPESSLKVHHYPTLKCFGRRSTPQTISLPSCIQKLFSLHQPPKANYSIRG